MPSGGSVFVTLDKAEGLNALACEDKTLRGTIDEAPMVITRLIAQVSLYSNSMGLAFSQSTSTPPMSVVKSSL